MNLKTRTRELEKKFKLIGPGFPRLILVVLFVEAPPRDENGRPIAGYVRPEPRWGYAGDSGSQLYVRDMNETRDAFIKRLVKLDKKPGEFADIVFLYERDPREQEPSIGKSSQG